MSNQVEPDPETDPEAPLTGEAEAASVPGEETLDSLRRERDDLETRWQRATADYANLKRRHAQDLEGHVRRRMVPLLESLLLVVDNLEMALKSPTESQDAQNLALGVQLTRDQFIRALETEEVARIEDEGQFNPERHQAMDTVTDSDAEPGSIVETVRPGYTWRDTVLRYSQVRVAAAPAGTADESGAEPGAEA